MLSAPGAHSSGTPTTTPSCAFKQSARFRKLTQREHWVRKRTGADAFPFRGRLVQSNKVREKNWTCKQRQKQSITAEKIVMVAFQDDADALEAAVNEAFSKARTSSSFCTAVLRTARTSGSTTRRGRSEPQRVRHQTDSIGPGGHASTERANFRFSSFGWQTCVSPPEMTLCARGHSTSYLGFVSGPNGPEAGSHVFNTRRACPHRSL